jgi:hypothetical protein
LGAVRILFLQNYERDSTEYGYGRQHQAQGYGLTEKNDATQGRNDRNTEFVAGAAVARLDGADFWWRNLASVGV